MEYEPIVRLTRDLKNASATLSHSEARYLVDAYYQMQQDRIRADSQIRSKINAEGSVVEPHEVLQWLSNNTAQLEAQIKRALDSYSDSQVPGLWAKSVVGIGPVISAGLLAHIDITKAPTAGHIWSFAGLNPKVEWKKGQKRPWNAALKTLAWKIGESFVKVSGNDNDVYGKLYLQRKAIEQAKNEAGAYGEQAKSILSKKNFRDDTHAKKAYLEGKLPPAHIHARAKRWAVKIFLAHYHAVAYENYYQKDAPVPYIIAHGEHVHLIPPPNWPMAA